MSTYTPIASQTIGSSITTVTFTNIPQTYTDLIIVLRGGCDNSSMRMQFNSDTGSNYSVTLMSGTGSAANSTRQSSQNAILIAGAYGAQTASSNTITQIQNYSNATTFKTVLSRNNEASSATEAFVGLWRNTNAITTVSLTAINGTGFWFNGSTVNLYGIFAGSPKATGGNIVSTDGTYWYHAFTSSGVFTPSSALTADVLVVAGGGGGGGSGPGGGAGGLLTFTSQSLTAINYTCTIGAGGAAGYTAAQVGQRGVTGSDSQFGALTLVKGGGGGGANDNSGSQNGLTGGSGGGAPKAGGAAPAGGAPAGGAPAAGGGGAPKAGGAPTGGAPAGGAPAAGGGGAPKAGGTSK